MEELPELRIVGANWAEKGRGSEFGKRISLLINYFTSASWSLGSTGGKASPALEEGTSIGDRL